MQEFLMQHTFNIHKLIVSSCVSALIAAAAIGLGGCGSDSSSDTPADAAPDSTSTDAAPDSTPAEDAPVDTATDVPAADSSDTDAAPTPSKELLYAIFHSTPEDSTDNTSFWFAACAATEDYPFALVLEPGWPLTSAGRVFLRQPGVIKVMKPDSPTEVEGIVNDIPGRASMNDNVIVASSTKAYAVLDDWSGILEVFNPITKTRTGSVDLRSVVVDRYRPNGIALFDAATKRLYITLTKHDLPALLLAVDTQTDEIIDLNGARPGLTLSLAGVAPSGMFWDSAKEKLIINMLGVSGLQGGLELVDLEAATTSWLVKFEPGSADDVWTRFSLISDTQGLVAVRNYTTETQRWFPVDLTSRTISREPLDVPWAFVPDYKGGLIGMSPEDNTYLVWNVVRYDLTSKTTTVLHAKSLQFADRPAGFWPYVWAQRPVVKEP